MKCCWKQISHLLSADRPCVSKTRLSRASALQRCNESSGAARLILVKPFIKVNTLCFTWEEGNFTFLESFFFGEPSPWSDACADWHIQMNEESIERFVLYLFHIITENIGNFHHEYCGVPWQALITLRHPSREMLVLDGRQTLGWGAVMRGGTEGGANYPFITGDWTPVPGGLAWPCLRRGRSGTPHYLTHSWLPSVMPVKLRAVCTFWLFLSGLFFKCTHLI